MSRALDDWEDGTLRQGRSNRVACYSCGRSDADVSLVGHREGCSHEADRLRNELATLRAEVETLKAESVQALARHYGCGEHVSFTDAWRWLAERVEVVRELQTALESHKSGAATAGGALLDRVQALKAERDTLAEQHKVEIAAADAAELRAEAAESTLAALREQIEREVHLANNSHEKLALLRWVLSLLPPAKETR